MTIQRFYWQQKMVAEHPGIVLNVGCNEDPAKLKQNFGYRVLNCDIEAFDSNLKRPNVVDILFDAAKDRWPFPDSYAALVVLGDMLEHFLVPDIEHILKEAYRVGHKLAITVPKDERIIEGSIRTHPDVDKTNPFFIYHEHQTVVTEDLLQELLKKSNWKVIDWQTVDYLFVPEGYFVLCERKTTPQSLGLVGGPC